MHFLELWMGWMRYGCGMYVLKASDEVGKVKVSDRITSRAWFDDTHAKNCTFLS